MKRILKLHFKTSFIIFAMTLLAIGCNSDDNTGFETPEGGEGTEETEVATLRFSEADPSTNITEATATGEVGTTVPGRIIFTSDETTQRRLYITQNISGAGDMPFNNFELNSDDLDKVLNNDGSIDLDGATRNAIDFTFNLPVPNIENGSIVYSFWTTRGKGDFRDVNKRLALGAGTITVTVGTGANPAAAVREFTNVKLFAPAQDGSTETFFSLLNETVYKINTGAEFRAFWDFGYYYGASGVSAGENASFASTNQYNTSFGFDVMGLEPDENEDDSENETLNNMFFNLSTMTEAEFNAVSMSGDLNDITSSGNQKITDLGVGDVIEFVDNYGKKGLIKITELQAGFRTSDFITFDVKIQP